MEYERNLEELAESCSVISESSDNSGCGWSFLISSSIKEMIAAHSPALDLSPLIPLQNIDKENLQQNFMESSFDCFSEDKKLNLRDKEDEKTKIIDTNQDYQHLKMIENEITNLKTLSTVHGGIDKTMCVIQPQQNISPQSFSLIVEENSQSQIPCEDTNFSTFQSKELKRSLDPNVCIKYNSKIENRFMTLEIDGNNQSQHVLPKVTSVETTEERSQPSAFEDSQMDLFECGVLSEHDGTHSQLTNLGPSLQHQSLSKTTSLSLSLGESTQNIISLKDNSLSSQSVIHKPDNQKQASKTLLDRVDILSDISAVTIPPISTCQQSLLSPFQQITVSSQFETNSFSFVHKSDSFNSEQVSKSISQNCKRAFSTSTINNNLEETKKSHSEAKQFQFPAGEKELNLTCQTQGNGIEELVEKDCTDKMLSSQGSAISSLLLPPKDISQIQKKAQNILLTDGTVESSKALITNHATNPSSGKENDVQFEVMSSQQNWKCGPGSQISGFDNCSTSLSKSETLQSSLWKKGINQGSTKKTKTEVLIEKDHEKKMSSLHRFATLCNQMVSYLDGTGESHQQSMDIESYLQRCDLLIVKMYSMQKEEKTKLCTTLKNAGLSKQKKKVLKTQLEHLKSRHKMLMDVVNKHAKIKNSFKKNEKPHGQRFCFSQESQSSQKLFFSGESWEEKSTCSNSKSHSHLQDFNKKKNDDRSNGHLPKSSTQIQVSYTDTTQKAAKILDLKTFSKCAKEERTLSTFTFMDVQENQVAPAKCNEQYGIVSGENSTSQYDNKKASNEPVRASISVVSLPSMGESKAFHDDSDMEENVACEKKDSSINKIGNTAISNNQNVDSELICPRNISKSIIPQKRTKSPSRFLPPARKPRTDIYQPDKNEVPMNLYRDTIETFANPLGPAALKNIASMTDSCMKETSMCIDDILFTEFPDPASNKETPGHLKCSEKHSNTYDTRKTTFLENIKNASKQNVVNLGESEDENMKMKNNQSKAATLNTPSANMCPSANGNSICIDNMCFKEHQDPSYTTKYTSANLLGSGQMDKYENNPETIGSKMADQKFLNCVKYQQPNRNSETGNDNGKNKKSLVELPEIQVCATSDTENISSIPQKTSCNQIILPISVVDIHKGQSALVPHSVDTSLVPVTFPSSSDTCSVPVSLPCTALKSSPINAQSKQDTIKHLKDQGTRQYVEALIIDDLKENTYLTSSHMEDCSKEASSKKEDCLIEHIKVNNNCNSSFVTATHSNDARSQNSFNIVNPHQNVLVSATAKSNLISTSSEHPVVDIRPSSPCSTEGSSLFPVSSKEIVRRVQSRQLNHSFLPIISNDIGVVKSYNLLDTSTDCLPKKESLTKEKYVHHLKHPVTDLGIPNIKSKITVLPPRSDLCPNPNNMHPTISSSFNLEPTPESIHSIMTSSLDVPVKFSVSKENPKPTVKRGRKKKSKTESQFTQTSPEILNSDYDLMNKGKSPDDLKKEKFNLSRGDKNGCEQSCYNHSSIVNNKSLSNDSSSAMVKRPPVNVQSLISGLKTVQLIADQEVTSSSSNKEDIPFEFWDEDFTHITMSRHIWDSVVDW